MNRRMKRYDRRAEVSFRNATYNRSAPLYDRIWMTVANQVVLFSLASLFGTLSASRGKLFAPLSLRHIFEAARIGMKTIILPSSAIARPFSSWFDAGQWRRRSRSGSMFAGDPIAQRGIRRLMVRVWDNDNTGRRPLQDESRKSRRRRAVAVPAVFRRGQGLAGLTTRRVSN